MKDAVRGRLERETRERTRKPRKRDNIPLSQLAQRKPTSPPSPTPLAPPLLKERGVNSSFLFRSKILGAQGRGEAGREIG
jgi:hypothetical protein